MHTISAELLVGVAALILVAVAAGTLCARIFMAASRAPSGPPEDGLET